MGTIKTLVNDASVKDFINKIPEDIKRKDSFTLLEMYSRITGEKARMWGASIIGFGMYHYKSERSRQEGDWPLAAYSPRVQNLTLYVMSTTLEFKDLFGKLGKYKTSKACLYINKLKDVDLAVLEKIIKKSFDHSKKTLKSK